MVVTNTMICRCSLIMIGITRKFIILYTMMKYENKNCLFPEGAIGGVRRCSVKKVFLKILLNFQENTQACNFIKKETLTQVLSCEFCEISKNTSSYSTPPMSPSGKRQFLFSYLIIVFNMMNFLVIPIIIL